MDTTRLQYFIRRHLHSQKSQQIPSSIIPEVIFEERNNDKKDFLNEELKPIYLKPEDIIDEFGRFRTSTNTSELSNETIPLSEQFVLPKHLETSGEIGLEKIKFYMKRRFPERLQQCKSMSAVSEQVYTAWRSRTRKREAEWGDPEDLGRIRNDPRPETVKIAPECPQKAVEPKFLLPSYFITNLMSVGSKLYYSNRPSMQPTTPVSRFMANTAVWSPSERKTFIELYLQHPKNFGRISAQLPNKSCEQCVEFYYRHKKEYKLKQMVASYRKAMVAQRKLILNTATNTMVSSNTNLNILPPISTNSAIVNNTSDEDSSIKKKTGRPVGRPKNKEK